MDEPRKLNPLQTLQEKVDKLTSVVKSLTQVVNSQQKTVGLITDNFGNKITLL